MPRSASSILIFVFLAGAIALPSFAERTLTNFADIRAMLPSEVEEDLNAKIEGQVLSQQKAHKGLFLYDGAVGIYVSHVDFPEITDQIKPGDWVKVKGLVMPGGYTPYVIASHVEIIKHETLPEPMPFTTENNLTAMDCQWVSINGRLISVSRAADRYFINAIIEDGTQRHNIHIPYSDAGLQNLTNLMFRNVQAKATFTISFNLKQQAIGHIFMAHSTDEITPTDSDTLASEAPFVPLSQLLRKDSSSHDIVRTSGIVTGVSGNILFLRGESSSLRVELARDAQASPGDVVEVTGLAWTQPISPAFRALKIKTLRKEAAPSPIPVTLGSPISEIINYELIQLDAELIDIGKSFVGSDIEQQVLLCRSGQTLFKANLPMPENPINGLSIGAQLRLIGNSRLTQAPNRGGKILVEGLSLQLSGSDAIQILKQAPWWTFKHTLWMLAALVSVLTLILAWTVILRRTLDKQSRQIGIQVEREAILSERQRIARELHDNLEQGLAGIAIQLKGCLRQSELITARQVNDIKDKALAETLRNDARTTQASIKVVQDMLSYCSTESRSTILDLRNGLLERMDLPAALKHSIAPLSKEHGARIKLNIDISPVRMERRLERNLLLIAREAATNAARHASPNTIEVTLTQSANHVRLIVSDDGSGFDLKALETTSRFGIQGMRERVNNLKGKLEIDSALGKGTTVTVNIPLNSSIV